MVARSVFPRLFVSQNIHGSGLRKSPGLFGPRFRSVARVSRDACIVDGKMADGRKEDLIGRISLFRMDDGKQRGVFLPLSQAPSLRQRGI